MHLTGICIKRFGHVTDCQFLAAPVVNRTTRRLQTAAFLQLFPSPFRPQFAFDKLNPAESPSQYNQRRQQQQAKNFEIPRRLQILSRLVFYLPFLFKIYSSSSCTPAANFRYGPAQFSVLISGFVSQQAAGRSAKSSEVDWQ